MKPNFESLNRAVFTTGRIAHHQRISRKVAACGAEVEHVPLDPEDERPEQDRPGKRDGEPAPAMLRTALAAGDPELAARLAEGLEPLFAVREHALCAARAQLAEAAGDHAEAAVVAFPPKRDGATIVLPPRK